MLLFAARDDATRRFDAPICRCWSSAASTSARPSSCSRARAGGGRAERARPLVEHTGGNALALLEVPGALSAAQLAGAEPLPAALPLTQRVERIFLDRVRRLPDATQRLLLVAAADDTGRLSTVLQAAAALGSDGTALDAAEEARLVAVHGPRLEFQHSLVRSAVYQGAASNERRAAHRALADALGEDEADRRAWHRAAAALDPDEDVLRELDEAAARASARGGHAAAARRTSAPPS